MISDNECRDETCVGLETERTLRDVNVQVPKYGTARREDPWSINLSSHIEAIFEETHCTHREGSRAKSRAFRSRLALDSVDLDKAQL